MTFKEMRPALCLLASLAFAAFVFWYKTSDKDGAPQEIASTQTQAPPRESGEGGAEASSPFESGESGAETSLPRESGESGAEASSPRESGESGAEASSSRESGESGAGETSEEKAIETVVAENFFALLVGVDEYQNRCDYLPNLRYSGADVLKLKRALVEKVGVPEENIRTLTTLETDPAKRPTRENIVDGLGWLEDKSRPDSTVLAMFTGHGFETKDGEAAFASEDVELRENGVLKAETAISASALAKGLQKDDAKFKIFIVDACRTPASVDGKLGMFVAPPSFARLDKTGLAFAQSCNVGETSYETTELGGGVFTHFFVEGLNGKAREADGRVTFWGVAGYAAEKTGGQKYGKEQTNFHDAANAELHDDRLPKLQFARAQFGAVVSRRTSVGMGLGRKENRRRSRA